MPKPPEPTNSPNNLPPLSKLAEQLFHAGGENICKALFAGELLSNNLSRNIGKEGIHSSPEDIVSDIVRKREETSHALDSASLEIVARTLNNFPDNANARKIMINDLAYNLENDTSNDKTLSITPSAAYTEIARRTISIMEDKARTLLPKQAQVPVNKFSK